MHRIIVNGHGWSGSSAFIDLLNQSSTPDYLLVPGEFDDFRVPGTLRELLESRRKPVSHRHISLISRTKFHIRASVSDSLWPSFLPGQNVSQSRAKTECNVRRIETKAFNDCVMRARDNSISPKENLNLWFDTLVNELGSTKTTAKSIIFEQLLLFDDCPELYDWLEFDVLILFIRSPSKQLQATLESTLLYNNYPWQAEFLIGSVGKNCSRKYEIFLDTTIKRYVWIINFLKHLRGVKVCIVDFDSFLYDYKRTIQKVMDFVDLNISDNAAKFPILASRERDKPWSKNIPELVEPLARAENAYLLFKTQLTRTYEVV
jgi:hypothetical protein